MNGWTKCEWLIFSFSHFVEGVQLFQLNRALNLWLYWWFCTCVADALSPQWVYLELTQLHTVLGPFLLCISASLSLNYSWQKNIICRLKSLSSFSLSSSGRDLSSCSHSVSPSVEEVDVVALTVTMGCEHGMVYAEWRIVLGCPFSQLLLQMWCKVEGVLGVFLCVIWPLMMSTKRVVLTGSTRLFSPRCIHQRLQQTTFEQLAGPGGHNSHFHWLLIGIWCSC